MTPIEIAAVVVIAIVAICVLVLLGMAVLWLLEKILNPRPRPPSIQFTDVHLTATREKVLVGQTTDIRFLFTILNIERVNHRFDATLEVADHAKAEHNNPAFSQSSLTTFVLKPGCKWTTTGTKSVTGKVTVLGPTGLYSAEIQGVVLVVAELD